MLSEYPGIVDRINERANHISDPRLKWTKEDELEFRRLLAWADTATLDQLEKFGIDSDIIEDSPTS